MDAASRDRFVRDGAWRFEAALDTNRLAELRATAAALPAERAGIRLQGRPELRSLLGPGGSIWAIASAALGSDGQPVRAILFDKTPAMNWPLGWHQDRTIAVAERAEVAGFGPWTIKDGLLHVAPPFELLAGMVTLRVHLDPVPASNAPLLIAPGSHRLGRIAAGDVADVVRRCGTVACRAEAGDVWLYATPILHASEAAVEPRHRRVLQVDYAAGELPGGLRWLGI